MNDEVEKLSDEEKKKDNNPVPEGEKKDDDNIKIHIDNFTSSSIAENALVQLFGKEIDNFQISDDLVGSFKKLRNFVNEILLNRALFRIFLVNALKSVNFQDSHGSGVDISSFSLEKLQFDIVLREGEDLKLSIKFSDYEYVTGLCLQKFDKTCKYLEKFMNTVFNVAKLSDG